jgi:hypothetical protein
VALSTRWGSHSGHLYVNVSQIEAFRKCERKWAFQYLNEQDGTGNSFAQFGIAVHETLEDWFTWGDHPCSADVDASIGQVAESGLHHRPAPGTVDMCVEGQFTLRVDTPDGPVFFKGTRDLTFVDPTTPFAKMSKADQISALFVPIGSRPDSKVVLGDHKTTTDFRWAKTEDELREDIQAMVYALATMEQYAVDEIECRWVYYRTRGARKSERRTIVVTRDHALRVVLEKAVPVVHQILGVRERQKLTVLQPRDLTPNVHHCSDYGGCSFREPCNISALDRIKGKMAHVNLKEKMLARIAEAKGTPAPTPAPLPAPLKDPINPPEAAKATTSQAHAASPPPAKKVRTPKAVEVAEQEVVIEVEAPEPLEDVVRRREAGAPDVPLADPGPPQGKGFTLLVNCVAVTERCTEAADIIAEAHAKVREGAGIVDYRMVEFGRGAGLLAAEVREILERGDILDDEFVIIDAHSAEGSAVLQTFIDFSGTVIRGT